jgi:hypothetical protein
MIYVQQIRSRKESLVPFRQEVEGDVKFEIVDVSTLNGVELVGMDSEQFIEVVTSPGTPGSQSGESPRPRKRAKLDHLSVEEKAQHRKMMNRISAQSARDRQKAFIVQQEKAIKIITTENEALKEENKVLKGKNEKLTEENVSLRAIIADYENKLKKMSSALVNPSAPVIIKEEPTSETEATECCGPFEPAVLSTVPLQKGPDLQQTLAFLLLIWALSLLIWTPPKSLKHLKFFLDRSSAQKVSLSSRLSPQSLATEKRARTLQNWATMKADLPG